MEEWSIEPEISIEMKEPEGPSVEEVVKGCKGCKGRGVLVSKGRGGYLQANQCQCLSGVHSGGRNWDQLQEIERLANKISKAEIPNRYLSVLTSPSKREDIKEWLASFRSDKSTNDMLFFFGDVGTGKTHAAIGLLLEILFDENMGYGLYVPLYRLISTRHEYLDVRYDKNHNEKEHYRRIHTWFVDRVKQAGIVIIDEMGQEKLNYDERKFVFNLLDIRYSAGLPTVLISNHCDNRSLSLDNKLLTSMVGKRISSRMGSAQSFYFEGKDLRLQEGFTSISKEEIESFRVPTKILTHDEDTHQIMTWLTRNPAFQTVSNQERKDLSYIDPNGEERDKDRPKESFYQDVWIAGDSLTINGPICDHEDKKLYAILLKELAKLHSFNQPGLTLRTSYRQVLLLQEHDLGGKQVSILRRQLDRLNRMHFTFRNAKGDKWSGPLITTMAQIGSSSDRKVELSFNHYMIAFYRIHAYTTFNAKLSQKLMGDGSAFYLFFMSHAKDRSLRPITFEKCKKLLAIPEEVSRKAALRRISKATKDLIGYGVLSASTIFKNNSLHAAAGPSILN